MKIILFIISILLCYVLFLIRKIDNTFIFMTILIIYNVVNDLMNDIDK